MQFLQMLLKEGKLSEEQALAYVDAIKKDIELVEEKEEKEEKVKEEVERVKAEEQAKEERCNDFDNRRCYKDQIKSCFLCLKFQHLTLCTLIRFKIICHFNCSLLERAAKEAAEGLKKEKQEHELILR